MTRQQFRDKWKTLKDYELDKVELHITSKCNLACPYCYGDFFRDGENYNLDYNIIKETFASIPENTIIFLSGMYSEPLLHPKIVDILELLVKSQQQVAIYTNGLLLTPEIIEQVNKLNGYITFNVTASTYVNKLEKLKKIMSKISITKNATVIDKKIEIEADNVDYRESWDKLEYKYYKKKFSKCEVIKHSVSVDAEGNIYPCPETCSREFKHLSIGNLYKTNIMKLWNSDAHKELYKKFIPNKEKCRCCPVDNEYNEYKENLK